MSSFSEAFPFPASGAPEKGYILAYYADALVFEPYVLKGEYPVFAGCDALKGEMPLECHLFDEHQEWRMVYKESTGERLVLSFTEEEEHNMDSDLLFAERVLVKPQYAASDRLPEALTIINRYRYSEYDTLVLDNYRISAKTS